MKNRWIYLIIALILSSICSTGFAGYDLGQPVPLDTRPTTAGSTGWFQSNPAMASSGSIYLAVWVDMRDAGRGSDLYATRISADGNVLDPVGIRLTTGASIIGKPDVCWNGQSFFIVYADTAGTVGTRIMGLRVSPVGAILDPAPILVVDAGDMIQLRDPHVAWNGTYHLVAWIGDFVGPSTEGSPSYGGVYNRTVGLNGEVSPLVRTTYTGSLTVDQGATGVSVACSPDGAVLIVWSDDRNSATTSTDLYGSMGREFTICAAAGAQEQPECCWLGGQFLVVWTDSDSYYRSIRGRRISTTGMVLDSSPLIISFVTQKQSEPEATFDGTNALVTWARKNSTRGQTPAQFDIYAGRVSANGSVLDGSGFPVCTSDDRQMRPCVASAGDGSLIAWMDSRSDVAPTVPNMGFQVRGRRVASGGALIGSEFPLTQSAPQHKVSCSAFNGRQFLVCFDEWNNGERNLYGELIDAYTGQPVTTAPFVISAVTIENPHPAAAWNGESFVVTWLGGVEMSPGRILPMKVMAARVTPAGGVLDPAGLVVFDGGTSPIYVRPAIASDGDRCLIVLRANGAFVSRSGVVSPTFKIGDSTSTAVYESAAVCWTGQRYIVAWKQQYSTTYPAVPGGIDYTTVSADGVPSAVQRITDTTYPDYFKLACNGQNVLLAAYGPQILTRRLSLTGTLLDTTPVSVPGSADADSVSLAWNGMEYVLTWMAGGSQDDMKAVRINGDNQLIDAAPIAITDTPISEIGGSMCAGPTGRVFLAYAGWEPAPFGSIRAKGMYLDEWMNLTSLSQVKGLFEGANISLSGATGPVVTSIFLDRFYVQDARNFGIGIWADTTGVAIGDEVALTGRLTNLNGEAVLNVLSPQVLSHGNPVPAPLGMIARNLGGVGSNSVFSTVDNALGLYNVGLLVKVFGRVTSVRDGCFYIDDGSKVDSPESAGVKVVTNGTDVPALDSMVKVTGISSSYQLAGKTYRLIRAIEWSPILDDDLPPPPPL